VDGGAPDSRFLVRIGASVQPVDRWHLPSIEATGKREPRVLFSRPECRAVLIDLQAGEEMGEHRMHEHAVVHVISGKLGLSSDDHGVECEAGTIVAFEAGESRSAHALEPSRILLVLAPWPGDGHYHDGEAVDPRRLPTTSVAPIAP
jgi:quercetin dioxygenase-like cupin family protein